MHIKSTLRPQNLPFDTGQIYFNGSQTTERLDFVTPQGQRSFSIIAVRLLKNLNLPYLQCVTRMKEGINEICRKLTLQTCEFGYTYISCTSTEEIPGERIRVDCTISPDYEVISGSGDPSLTKPWKIIIVARNTQTQVQQEDNGNVRNRNRAPRFTTQPPSQTVYTKFDTYYYDADAVDPDGDPLEYAVFGAPVDIKVRDPTNGVIGGDILETGTFTLDIGVRDPYGAYDRQFHTIQVNP